MKIEPLQLSRNVAFLVDEERVCTRADLAKAMDTSVAAVGQLIRGETKGLKPTNLVNASRRLGVSVEDLVTREIKPGHRVAESLMHYRNDSREIPKLDLSASMGDGAHLPDHVEVVYSIAVSISELRRRVSFSSPSALRFLTGYGNSMEPTFRDGDLLLVDTGVSNVDIDAVYVLELNDALYIKTLQRRPDGSILMISDNKKYEPYLIRDADRDKFVVRGRVLLVWNAKHL